MYDVRAGGPERWWRELGSLGPGGSLYVSVCELLVFHLEGGGVELVRRG